MSLFEDVAAQVARSTGVARSTSRLSELITLIKGEVEDYTAKVTKGDRLLHMDERPIIHVTGLPGSGKSRLASAMADLLHGLYVEADLCASVGADGHTWVLNAPCVLSAMRVDRPLFVLDFWGDIKQTKFEDQIVVTVFVVPEISRWRSVMEIRARDKQGEKFKDVWVKWSKMGDFQLRKLLLSKTSLFLKHHGERASIVVYNSKTEGQPEKGWFGS